MQQTLQALVEVAAQDPNAPPLSRLPEVQATMALARKATVSPALLESSEAVLQVMEARAEARAEAAKPTVSTPPTRPPAYRPPVARVCLVEAHPAVQHHPPCLAGSAPSLRAIGCAQKLPVVVPVERGSPEWRPRCAVGGRYDRHGGHGHGTGSVWLHRVHGAVCGPAGGLRAPVLLHLLGGVDGQVQGA